MYRVVPANTETISVYGPPSVNAETGVKGLIDDGMARTSQEMAELHCSSALVNHEAAHGLEKSRSEVAGGKLLWADAA